MHPSYYLCLWLVIYTLPMGLILGIRFDSRNYFMCVVDEATELLRSVG